MRVRSTSSLCGVAGLILAASGASGQGPAHEPPAAEPAEHVVQPDETLWRISRRYGIPVEALMRENGIDTPTGVAVGRRLVIPDPSAAARDPLPAAPDPAASDVDRHVVRSDETVWRIARRYGVSVEALARANGIDDPTQVDAGRVLAIPQPGDVVSSAPGDLSTPPPARRPARPRAGDARRVAAMGDGAEEALHEARFEQALQKAEAGLALLDAGGYVDEGTARAQFEVLAATAHVALGRNDLAAAALERALAAAPALELDPAVTSPKLLRLYDAVRRSAAARR